MRVYSHQRINKDCLLAGDYFVSTVCEIHFSGFIEALDSKRILRTLTSETISDSAECYAGFSVLFESSAVCMQPVSTRLKNNLQLLFVETILNFTVAFYVEFRSF